MKKEINDMAEIRKESISEKTQAPRPKTQPALPAEYTIVREIELDAFVAKTNALLRSGWQLAGGAFRDGMVWCQTAFRRA